ncbi:hypothetical protein [aff. Roholtiella sp. LEGE 12411]|uniref:hypothetical protein n=1 Tax=aff. Roholtiella sp. LEGE 12411 TaxID=1828822 RepID=UPI00188190F5|nr:hypothetical protein [aff. Roholtiella sp. LEGE 12411]MBE9035628.1 hypothetical protein [aff. Roholtiella sp. LEGE 12411]
MSRNRFEQCDRNLTILPARSPKTRGNSIGRVQDQAQTQRTKHPVVKKQSKSTPDKQKAA